MSYHEGGLRSPHGTKTYETHTRHEDEVDLALSYTELVIDPGPCSFA